MHEIRTRSREISVASVPHNASSSVKINNVNDRDYVIRYVDIFIDGKDNKKV